MNWLFIKSKLLAIGAALVGVAAVFLRMNYLKNKTEKLERERDIAVARAHIKDVQKRVERKERDRLLSKEESLSKELSKEGEDFEGVDNLSNPNDF